MQKLYVDDLPEESLSSRYALVRVDFNVPIKTLPDKTISIYDDSRIRAALETINYLTSRKVKVILCSHLGRPKGPSVSLSLATVAARLRELLPSSTRVNFVADCIGETVEVAKKCMNDGDVLLLENLRFYEEEKQNDPKFASELVKGIDFYVNDAFGSAHRGDFCVISYHFVFK